MTVRGWALAVAGGGAGLALGGLLVRSCGGAPVRTSPRLDRPQVQRPPVGEGVLRPVERARVPAPRAGIILRWEVAVGEQVRAGSPLASYARGSLEAPAPSPVPSSGLSGELPRRLPPPTFAPSPGLSSDLSPAPPPDLGPLRRRLSELDAALAKAPAVTEARVQAAKAALAAAEAERRRADGAARVEARAQARADLASAQALLKDREAELARQRDLALQGYGSEGGVASAELGVTSAQDRIAAATRALDGSDQTSADRSDEAAKAVRKARRDLDDAVLRRRDLADLKARREAVARELAEASAPRPDAPAPSPAPNGEPALPRLPPLPGAIAPPVVPLRPFEAPGDLDAVLAPRDGIVLSLAPKGKVVKGQTLATLAYGEGLEIAFVSRAPLGVGTRVLVGPSSTGRVTSVGTGGRVVVRVDGSPGGLAAGIARRSGS